jgi:formylmethanofuran dehydrogenase subunit A
LIEALEDIPKNNTNSFLKYKKPMTWVMSRKIKNRANLAGLNLMGY